MSAPLVTIGIPTRNRAALLERAVRSVLAQEGVELEIIVSDNASTDGTRGPVRGALRGRPRDSASSGTRQTSARRRTSAPSSTSLEPLFMWLADDDWIDPGYVAGVRRVLDEHPDHVVACGRGRYYRGGDGLRRASGEPLPPSRHGVCSASSAPSR